MHKTYPILKVIVGSQAHGLAGPDSDTDYRSVYAVPTQDILALGSPYKKSQWIEGENQDDTAWEIGHFLWLALQCNPTILEAFLAPTVKTLESPCLGMSDFGYELRELFPYVWTPEKAFAAFLGYGRNQQKKFLDKKDKRPEKYAVAHIRTLLNLIELLETGTFTVDMLHNPYYITLKRIKAKNYTIGEVVDITEKLTHQAEIALQDCRYNVLPDEVRIQIANKFLMRVRQKYWS